MTLTQKYGPMALIAGASEGIGAAFSKFLAASGINLFLVARRRDPLYQLADELRREYGVEIACLCCDLSEPDAAFDIRKELDGREVGMVVYNAALSFIGHFEENTSENHREIAFANMITPMDMIHLFGKPMLKNGRGAIILMASLAGFQGSGYLTAYAASKAFTRVIAESLWYEWKNHGVDVIACCAGATATPNFLKTNPGKKSFFAPRVQLPEEIVEECMSKLGTRPSHICGRGNRLASFFMQRILPRKAAINIMGNTAKKMYRL